MSFTTITATASRHIASITIQRPEHRNSLTSETIQELLRAFGEAEKDDSIRCILLSGAGTEAFCAGADLHELNQNSTPDGRRVFFNSIARLIEAIFFCPIPVVCAVHGYAFAGGCGLVAASDITIAADDAVFALPEVGIGLAPMVVMAPLSRTMHSKLLSYMALSGQRLRAAEALESGLITKVVPKTTLTTEAQNVCETIIKQSSGAIRATKAALRELRAGDSLGAIMHELADRSALVSLENDAVEGLLAFREKRQPSWRKT